MWARARVSGRDHGDVDAGQDASHWKRTAPSGDNNGGPVRLNSQRQYVVDRSYEQLG